jgi:hypothetical protein
MNKISEVEIVFLLLENFLKYLQIVEIKKMWNINHIVSEKIKDILLQ